MMEFIDSLNKRILILDGAMGTMIQRLNLKEADFRNNLNIKSDIKVAGCNDLLCIAQPEKIREIHSAYIEAGADIIETNSFNANALSLEEYGLQDMVGDINRSAVRVAREAVDIYASSTPSPRNIFIAGSMGPSNVSLSLPQVAAARGIDFDIMRKAYCEQACSLVDEGVDLLLLETVFDTLNAKAAIAGIYDAFDKLHRSVPLMISVTIDERGRTLSGQNLEAFLTSIMHASPISVGLNCGFGADEMGKWLASLQECGCYVSMHPNAGLPDEMGNYTDTPAKMAASIEHYLKKGWLNIVGGCCGTTPEHIRAISNAARKYSPRQCAGTTEIERHPDTMRLSGLKDLEISPAKGFVKVGERCNVAGSRKFLRLINEGNLSQAAEIASSQIDKGASILDINMDDAMLNAGNEMEKFVTLLGGDGTVANVPIMVDSSDMRVINSALRHIQGRPIVNSISLKEGEAKFLDNANEIKRLGGAVVIMAFDEKGQATTFERRIEICRRAYDLLRDEAGFKGEDIVFDPNVLTIATGMKEHDRYALDFLDAVSWIKENLPGAKVSGGISNLSFSFRGNDKLREAMHTVFLHHAISRGMDMAIVNPATSIDIESVNPDLRSAIEDVFFMRRPDATDRLLAIAAEMKAEAERLKALKAGKTDITPQKSKNQRKATLESLVEKGISADLQPLLDSALAEEGSAIGVINNRLMKAMQHVGDEFGAGRMFLPQVVRSAEAMRHALDYLTPLIEKEAGLETGSGAKGKFVIATVKGDVHDIGKNIVGVILKCAGFDVVDLGVMVEKEKILEVLRDTGARFVGLSGLITPSLSEMVEVAKMLEVEGLTDVRLFVGGATTSELHTAVKIAPHFSGLTVHTRDAARLPVIASTLADTNDPETIVGDIRRQQESLRDDYARNEANRVTSDKKIVEPRRVSDPSMAMPAPMKEGIRHFRLGVQEVEDHVNWRPFLHVWKIPPALADEILRRIEENDSDDMTPAVAEGVRIVSDAKRIIDRWKNDGQMIEAKAGLIPARRSGDDIVLHYGGKDIVLPTIRRTQTPTIALSDFVNDNDDHIGLFAVSFAIPDKGSSPKGDYQSLLQQSVADRLAEAATEVIHNMVHCDLWGLDTPRSIRPAVGYPSLPDQSAVFILDNLLNYASIGIKLTENGAMSPSSSTTGLIIGNPDARYFDVGKITSEMAEDYSRRRNIPLSRIRSLLGLESMINEKRDK